MPSVAVDNLVLLEKTFKIDYVSLQHLFYRIPLLKYRYRGSFPCDYVPTLDKAIILVDNVDGDLVHLH